MFGWSIKERILFIAIFPVLLIALVLYVYFMKLHLKELDNGLIERGLTIARHMAPASEYGVVTGNVELLRILSTPIVANEEVTGLKISGVEGSALIMYGSITMEPANKDYGIDNVCAESAESLLFCQPIYLSQLDVDDYKDESATSQREVVGLIYLEITKQYNERKSTNILIKSFFLTLISLIAAALLAVFVSRQLTNPLMSLTMAVKKIKDGELDVNVDVTNSREIGTLQSGFNAMVTSMRNAQQLLQSRVDEVTAQWQYALSELEDKNNDLKIQQDKLQQASNAKSRFLATMSHEIRTPLSGMLGMLSILRETRLDELQLNYLKNIDYSAKALRVLIDDILDLSRIEAGKLVIHESEFSLSSVINEIAAILAPNAHAKGLEFICDINPDVSDLVVGDSSRLRQVLINLVSNAIKFTEHGRVILRVISVTDPAESLRLTRFEVEDSGIGIDPELQNYIFESFAQVDNTSTRRYAGTGLGTAISRELVSLMGGEIGLDSELDKGSLFWFEVPLEYVEFESIADCAFDKYNILLLEENDYSGMAIVKLVESCGLRVDWIKSAALLRDSVNRNNYNMVVFSENSRNPQYTELAGSLRQAVLDADSRPYLVHLTYYNSNSDADIFDAQVHKPLSAESLKCVINKLILHLSDNPSSAIANPKNISNTLDVLIVEDDPINAKVLAYFLDKMGHRVHRAVNGKEALPIMLNQALDLVFMDMRMPEMDGPAVTRRWRDIEAGKSHLPIIALTANVTLEDKDACISSGMDDFITKPVEQDKLIALFERHIKPKG